MEQRAFLKIVPLGSGGVGKTSICIRLRDDVFSADYDPTIEENYRKQFVIDDETVVPEFVDVLGQEEFVTILNEWIREADGIFLIYSITSLASFAEIQEKYYNMILRVKEDAKVPIVLIGNKCDLENQRGVTREMGEELAKKYGIPFFETSAKTSINVFESLTALVREIRRIKYPPPSNQNKKKKSECKLS